MKNIIAKLSIGLLAGSCLSGYAQAECSPSPDCGTLGYTKSDTGCNGASFVRCPFNTSKVACLVSVTCADGGFLTEKPADQICTEINFGGNKCYKDCRAKTCEEKGQKTCNGVCIATSQCCTNADCGSGKICNASRVCEENKTCAVGDIYYSDKTCSNTYNSSKKAIGVVGYVGSDGKSGLIAAKVQSSSTLYWATEDVNLSCIKDAFGSDGGANDPTYNPNMRADRNGKSNTNCIMTQVASVGTGKYPAGEYCNGLSVEGVTGWYLPAGGELYDVIVTNLTKVNSGLSKITGATAIPTSTYHWSSSEHTLNDCAWTLRPSDGYWSYYAKGYVQYLVRCVLAF